MSETPQETGTDDEPGTVDPTDFGPEAIDGSRPPGTQPASTSDDPEPGDPDLHADPEDEPSS